MRIHRSLFLTTMHALVVFHLFVGQTEARDLEALINKQVVITLTDGRTPRGTLSAKSGNEFLVLRTELPDLAIESRFSFGIIQAVHQIASQSDSVLPRPPEPTPIIPSVDSDVKRDDIPPPPAPAPDAADDADQKQGNLSLPSPNSITAIESTIIPMEMTETPHGSLIPDLRRAVTALKISATTGQWNPDSQVDGLLVRVEPTDAFGNVVPVEGNLDVQLATETKLWSGGRDIRDGDRFQISERWSVPIHAMNFSPAGTMIRLPFRSFRPDRDLDIAPDALVFARLRLSSAGVFDASEEFVRLRSPSRIRDDQQQFRGQRLFSIEGAPRW